MKQLERQLTKADTIYDFFFAKGPQNVYQSRRVMATKKFAEAIRKIVEIREGARRTRSGLQTAWDAARALRLSSKSSRS